MDRQPSDDTDLQSRSTENPRFRLTMRSGSWMVTLRLSAAASSVPAEVVASVPTAPDKATLDDDSGGAEPLWSIGWSGAVVPSPSLGGGINKGHGTTEGTRVPTPPPPSAVGGIGRVEDSSNWESGLGTDEEMDNGMEGGGRREETVDVGKLRLALGDGGGALA